MPQSSTGQHERAVSIGEAPYHSGSAPDLPHDALNPVVGADSRPVLTREAGVSQCFLHTVFELLRRAAKLHAFECGYDFFGLCCAALRFSCAWIALSIAAASPIHRLGTTMNMLR